MLQAAIAFLFSRSSLRSSVSEDSLHRPPELQKFCSSFSWCSRSFRS